MEMLLRMLMEHLPRLPVGVDPDQTQEVPHILVLFSYLMAEVHGWANVYRARHPILFQNMNDSEVIIRAQDPHLGGTASVAQRSEKFGRVGKETPNCATCNSCTCTPPTDVCAEFWKE